MDQLTGFASSNSHLPIKLNCLKFPFYQGILEQSYSEGLKLRQTNLEQQECRGKSLIVKMRSLSSNIGNLLVYQFTSLISWRINMTTQNPL